MVRPGWPNAVPTIAGTSFPACLALDLPAQDGQGIPPGLCWPQEEHWRCRIPVGEVVAIGRVANALKPPIGIAPSRAIRG
jgi:hypothetical protein